MSEFGLDEEKKEVVEEQETNLVEFKSPEKKPFAYWTVGGKEYRLKLRTRMICRLEEKFKKNLFTLFATDGLPPIGHMLTIAQAAMVEWQHGITFDDVMNLFDQYCDEGGTQTAFMLDVIMPTMAVSGFFTPKQTEKIAEKKQEVKDLF